MHLLFDIGGSNMRISSSDSQSILKNKVFPAPQDFNEALVSFKKVSDELVSGGKIEAMAGGIAGPLDKGKTKLVASSHLPGWVNKPWKSELENLFGCPVYLENDSALAALGEAISGAGQEFSVVCYITLGTGVGGARIVDKRIDKNSLGFEPGHQIIVVGGHPCSCGGKGHLETYVSGYYIEKNYRQRAENISDPKIWDEISKYLSIGIYNSIVHWSPDIVVLGGSVTKSIPLDRVGAYLGEIQTVFPTTPKLVKASLGDEAGLYGALVYLNQQTTT